MKDDERTPASAGVFLCCLDGSNVTLASQGHTDDCLATTN